MGGTTNSPRAQKEDSTGFIRLLGKIRAQAGAVMLHHAATRFGVIRGDYSEPHIREGSAVGGNGRHNLGRDKERFPFRKACNYVTGGS